MIAKCPLPSPERSITADSPANAERITSFPCMSNMRTVFVPPVRAFTARRRPSSDMENCGGTCVCTANVADETASAELLDLTVSELLETASTELLDCDDEDPADEAGTGDSHFATLTDAS